ncbi:MAG: hypothetical protein NTW19_01395 [Planctomycetota bacterium]|nr:hypothetical protein [Planctomycetota bacterium]
MQVLIYIVVGIWLCIMLFGVVAILLSVLLAALVFVVLVFRVDTFAGAVLTLLPPVAGLVACVLLWRAGHDDAGVLVFLAGLLVMWPWSQLFRSK